MEFTTVSAINEFLLPPFIFMVAFCFLCCQIAEPARKKTETGQSHNPSNSSSSRETNPPKEAKITEQKVEPRIQNPQVQELVTAENEPKSYSDEEPIDKPDKAEEQVQKVQPDGLERLDKLSKREARKLMGALKLQQKRSGIELSLELTKATLKREFNSNPEKISKVMKEQLGIEVAGTIREKEEMKIAS